VAAPTWCSSRLRTRKLTTRLSGICVIRSFARDLQRSCLRRVGRFQPALSGRRVLKESAWKLQALQEALFSCHEDWARHLEEAKPLLVAGEDGRAASSWSCPSLLKAVHLRRYLDLVAGIRMQRCQAPICREYFRVGPRSRESLYQPRASSTASAPAVHSWRCTGSARAGRPDATPTPPRTQYGATKASQGRENGIGMEYPHRYAHPCNA
jgi:hypothetical protein